MSFDFFTADQIVQLKKSTLRADLVTSMYFDSETIHAWNGNWEMESGGETYIPMFGLGQISDITISGGTETTPVTTSVGGIPDGRMDIIGKALSEDGETEQNIQTISIQVFDEAWQVLGSPISIFAGFMQAPSVDRSPATETEGATMSVAIEALNVFYNRSLPPYGRNSDTDQKRRSPTDEFFEFTMSLTPIRVFVYPNYSG
jgi:hypothetical protein